MGWYYGDIRRRKLFKFVGIFGSIAIIVSTAWQFTEMYFRDECERKVNHLEQEITRWFRQSELPLFDLGIVDEGNNIVNEGYSLDRECGWLYGSNIKDEVQSFESEVQLFSTPFKR